MSTTIWSDFNFNDVLVKPPQKNSMGGQNVYIDTNSGTKSNPKFQLPRMKIPFGLDRNERSRSTRFNLELSVTDPAFYETISMFDDKILTEAAKHSKEWFGKTYFKSKIQAKDWTCAGINFIPTLNLVILLLIIARSGNPWPISINDFKYPHKLNFSFRISNTTCANLNAMHNPLIIKDCINASPASFVIPLQLSSFPSQ